MPFTCPNCHSSDHSLEIVTSIELPPDSLYDEITLQILECSCCLFSGLAIHQESRRGALDSEFTIHRGYRIKKDELINLKSMIQECPEPTNTHCKCKAHSMLGVQDSSGEWKGIKELDSGIRFDMKW